MISLLHHIVSKSAAKYPDREAISFNGSSMTYAELETESNKLAHGLLEIGVDRGDRVGIYMNRCIQSIVGAFGTDPGTFDANDFEPVPEPPTDTVE